MMFHLVIQVYKCAFDFVELLESTLERLPDVVRLSQAHLRWEHDVDLYKEVVAKVERAHGVDELDGGVVVEADPREALQEVRPRRVPGQQPDLLCRARRRNTLESSFRL